MKKINLNLGKRSYNILVSKRIDEFPAELKKINLPDTAVIITMEKIRKLYDKKLISFLSDVGFGTIMEVIPDSEKSKSFMQLSESIQNISNHVGSNPFFLIAFGGGVVGDLGGFIASIYKRGVDYIQLPTTLLSQVDSSIGGKVAVDLAQGKNLVGAFYQPRLVYSNIKFLETLPDNEIQNGMAEVIKYGLIESKELFELIEKICSKGNNKMYSILKDNIENIVYKCSKIKAKIVSKDEKDKKGIRAKLNFGHTIGHAVEAAFGYKKCYTHGQAISIGMICAIEISKELNILKEDILNRVQKTLEFFKLPVYIDKIKAEDIMDFFWYDKKFIKVSPRMILPEKLGKVKVVEDIPVDIVKKILKNRIKS